MDSVKPTSLKVEDIQVDLLVPNPDNINEMDEKTFGFLKENIKEVGFIDPVQAIPIQDGKYFILGGEHRWKAAKELGYNYVPCIVLTDTRWSDGDYTDLISFRMNVLRGAQKPEKFFKVYDRMASKFGADKLQEVFHVADKALWKRLTKDITKSLKEQGVPEAIVSQLETASDKAKSIESFNKKMNKILSDYSQGSNLGSLVFHGQKTIVVQASDMLWEAMNDLVQICANGERSVSSVLEGLVREVVDGLRNQNSNQAVSSSEGSDQGPSV